MKIFAGIDEAGRGALAGPVVAGAVIFPEDKTFDSSLFEDSKSLSDKKRRELFEIIKTTCDFGVGIVSAKEIDEIGIKKATHKAMKLAILSLQKTPDKLLVDGKDGFSFDISSEDFVRGDATVKQISASSIVAKVVRDDLMIDLHKKYPVFGFDENKGYGSPDHLGLLDQEIYCEEHRRSYDPLFTILTQRRLF